MKTIAVHHVRIPAMSTIGYGYGVDVENGDDVIFAGDHRPMRNLGEALDRGEDITVEVEEHQIIERRRSK